MSGKEIQTALHRTLAATFPPELVKTEWSVRKGASDTFADIRSYAPRLDVAVGPFNDSFERREEDARAIHRVRHPLVELLMEAVWEQNGGNIFRNRNPRCLIAIEVENATSSKHILGAITNVSMLGLLGIVVAPADRLPKVKRIHAYACKLKDVEKAPTDLFGNVACFGERELLDIIRTASRTAPKRARI